MGEQMFKENLAEKLVEVLSTEVCQVVFITQSSDVQLPPLD